MYALPQCPGTRTVSPGPIRQSQEVSSGPHPQLGSLHVVGFERNQMFNVGVSGTSSHPRSAFFYRRQKTVLEPRVCLTHNRYCTSSVLPAPCPRHQTVDIYDDHDDITDTL